MRNDIVPATNNFACYVIFNSVFFLIFFAYTRESMSVSYVSTEERQKGFVSANEVLTREHNFLHDGRRRDRCKNVGGKERAWYKIRV